MDIKITLDATPSFLEAIQGLTKALVPQAAAPSAPSTGTSKKDKAAKETAPPSELKEETTADGETQMVVAPKKTLEEVRQLVQRQSKDGKTEKIKGILAEFGAEKVPNLKPEQYGDFFIKVEAL